MENNDRVVHDNVTCYPCRSVEPEAANSSCSQTTPYNSSDTLPAVIFVVLLLVLSVAGNSMLLFIFTCRWRFLSATKVYICALALLDLFAALLIMPRDLLTLTFSSTRSLARDFDLDVFCKVESAAGYALHWASGFMLVAIATCRYLKAARLSHAKLPADQAKASRIAQLSRLVTSHRGAKLTSVVIVALSCVMTLPSVTIHGNAPDKHCLFKSRNESVPTNFSCYLSCGIKSAAIQGPEAVAFYTINIAVFLCVAVVLISLYVVAYCRLKDSASSQHDFQERHVSGSSVARRAHFRLSARPETTEDDDTHSHVIPDSCALGASSKRKSKEISTPNRLPPVSYGPHIVAPSPLAPDDKGGDCQTADDDDNDGAASAGGIVAQSSLRASQWRRRKLRGTTLTLVTITLIYLLSYLPYLFLSLRYHLYEDHCSMLSENGLIITELLWRSFFISNAANPVVYGFCNATFRSLLWKTLIWRREVF